MSSGTTYYTPCARDRLTISKGLVCIDAHRLLVASSLEDSILIKAHTPAHQGINKSKDFLRTKYFFLHMNKRLETVVSQCMDCQRYLPSQSDQPTIPLIATRSMEVLDTDHFEWDGKHYVVICDKLTGYLWSERLPNHTSAAVIKILRHICREYGYPNIVYSDG